MRLFRCLYQGVSVISEFDYEQRAKVGILYENFREHDPPQSALIPFLQDVQSEFGYLPKATIEEVSKLLQVSTSHVYGVATFYHQFRLRPKGRYLVTVCRGTACHVKGSENINEIIRRELGIEPESDTSQDGLFTVQQVRCVGACSLAPVMKIGEEFYGGLTPVKVRRILSSYRHKKVDP